MLIRSEREIDKKNTQILTEHKSLLLLRYAADTTQDEILQILQLTILSTSLKSKYKFLSF